MNSNELTADLDSGSGGTDLGPNRDADLGGGIVT